MGARGPVFALCKKEAGTPSSCLLRGTAKPHHRNTRPGAAPDGRVSACSLLWMKIRGFRKKQLRVNAKICSGVRRRCLGFPLAFSLYFSGSIALRWAFAKPSSQRTAGQSDGSSADQTQPVISSLTSQLKTGAGSSVSFGSPPNFSVVHPWRKFPRRYVKPKVSQF